jgi:hypothetical protein
VLIFALPRPDYQTPHAAHGTHDVTTAADRRQYPPPSDAARGRADAACEDGSRLACLYCAGQFGAAVRSRDARSGRRALSADTGLTSHPSVTLEIEDR